MHLKISTRVETQCLETKNLKIDLFEKFDNTLPEVFFFIGIAVVLDTAGNSRYLDEFQTFCHKIAIRIIIIF